MSDPLLKLIRARLLATGSELRVTVPELAPICASELELDRLISGYYMFFNEALSGDVSFLLSARANPTVEALRNLIYNLRNAKNHSENEAAVQAADRWRANYGSPQAAGDAIAGALIEGLEILAQIAVDVSKRQALSARWQDQLSVDVATIFDAVAADLNRNYRGRNRDRLIRVISKRLEVRPPQGDRKTVVADYCAQEMISERRPLPVPYSEVLDSLNLIGDSHAEGALLTAHAVAALAPELRDTAFVERVRETWLKAAG